MEVRLPLVWKSHPVLIDPHPPPSLHSRLSPYASPLVSPTSPHTFPQPPSLLPSLYVSLSPCRPPHRTLSIPQRSPFKPSPAFFPIPPPFSSLPAHAAVLSASRRSSLSRKKREKGRKNRCATPIGRARPGSRLHSFAARSWAWLKDELSLCHRLY